MGAIVHRAHSGRLLAASRGGQRVRRPGVRGLRGDQGRPGLARQRALRAVRPGAAKLMRPAGTRKVADLITAAGASAPADAVFGGRFATGETPRSTTSASAADEGDGVGGDGGTSMNFDLFPMEDL